MSTEVGWFRKTKDGEVGAYKKFLNMLRHFTQDDYILRFIFVDEVTNKPFIPRLTSLWNRNNYCAISPCQSGDKNTSGHWKCKASSWNGVRMRESFWNVSNFLIYLYCKRKASEILIFHFFRRSKMRRGGCSLTSILKLISKLLKDFSTRISRVATHQGSQKASSRAKHWDLSEPTPLKQYLKLLFPKSH